MRYIDVVLAAAKTLAWEKMSDKQREACLEEAVRGTGVKQSTSTIRRWAVQTGPGAGDDQ